VVGIFVLFGIVVTIQGGSIGYVDRVMDFVGGYVVAFTKGHVA
jgi:hypothetical protein